MGEVDTLALLSSMLEARTQEIASFNPTEPTMRPMSINEMSQVAPKTYNFCQICGVQGHFGFECSYNVYNSQSAQLGQMNSFEEGYGYNQYSNTFDQECVNQPDFYYQDNGAQNFSYHNQQQFEQQYYQSYGQPPQQEYQYPPLQEDLHVSQPSVDVQADQTNEMWDILNKLLKSFEDLKTQSLAIESQIAQLANSSTTGQLDYLPSSYIRSEEDLTAINLTSDQEYDSFSMYVDDEAIDKEKEHATDDEINDVAATENNVTDDEATKESNTEMVVVSLPQPVPKLPCIDKFALDLASTYKASLLKNTYFKVDVITNIVQDDISQILVENPYKVAPTFEARGEGEDGSVGLIFDVISQDVRMTPVKVRSGEKPPPEPPPYVKGVHYFRGVEFYRCFITKFSKTAQALNSLLLINDIFYFADACLETFCRIKTTTNVLDTFCGGEFMIEKVDIPPLPEYF
jgi:hypothetical protein